jgi:hypothetical protein
MAEGLALSRRKSSSEKATERQKLTKIKHVQLKVEFFHIEGHD